MIEQKFNINDIVHVDARIIGVREIDGELLYSLAVKDVNDNEERVYDIPECFIADVF